ncbi:IS5 family transposase [Beijerinckia sp. L45]|uniref:IS5 family transposase n=1 Tax=Beijerinckia sp. L45 TaxID=1641855 RepID=UPI001FEFA3DD|nr:IS5 family transposase [Beijerinckia sp. L45]
MELNLCAVPALSRTRRLGCAAGDAGRARTDRSLAIHDRLDDGARPLAGSGRKRGTHKEGFGRSRGGFTSKVHARADGQGRPLGFVVTGGEASDYTAVPQLLALPVDRPKAMLADKGYDGDNVRAALLMNSILPVIPLKANRKEPAACDFRRYKDRNHIERMFNKLKQFRRIATRYDKTPLIVLRLPLSCSCSHLNANLCQQGLVSCPACLFTY